VANAFFDKKKGYEKAWFDFHKYISHGHPTLAARVKIAPSCHTLEVQGASARCIVLSPVPVLLTVAGSEHHIAHRVGCRQLLV